ncbi:GDP-mannose 4,6-dehydratase [Rhizobium sp. BR 315]|uniref:GDP-mannose 4,6-dehydratase n=1 Tax=Rhizobium sp. BR 315 TaxID=3040014 RepID=UPI003D324859
MSDVERFYRGRNVLVTGAGGFIGSHLAEALVGAGANVTAMIKYGSSSHWGNLEYASVAAKKSMEVVSGNVEDSDFVTSVVKGKDVVFHLAALIAIPYSYLAPRSYVRTNVEGTLNVAEAARRLGTARVVHTSTSEVYGTALREPIDEDHPLQGQSPYSASKIGADKIAESYYRSFGTPIVTLRPFNTFGPRQSARAFIPTIISQALTREVIELGALDPMRDMTFVNDTVNGFLAAGAVTGVEGQTINLGTGVTASIGEFSEIILKLMKSSKKIVQDPKRLRPADSEVLKLVSDNSKAKQLLDWSPTTSVEDGLKATIEFVEANIKLYRPDIYNV